MYTYNSVEIYFSIYSIMEFCESTIKGETCLGLKDMVVVHGSATKRSFLYWSY